jgi:hypothetical protein
MTTVRTDLRNTRESARRIRFEPSGDMTQTNIQKEIEELDARIPQSAPNSRTVTTAGAIAIAITDVFVYFNKADAADINLPDSVAWAAYWNKSDFDLYLADVSGAASANNLTIKPYGTQKLDGVLVSILISTDFGSYRLRPAPAGGWIVK